MAFAVAAAVHDHAHATTGGRASKGQDDETQSVASGRGKRASGARRRSEPKEGILEADPDSPFESRSKLTGWQVDWKHEPPFKPITEKEERDFRDDTFFNAVTSRMAKLDERKEQKEKYDNDWANVPFAACELLRRQKFPPPPEPRRPPSEKKGGQRRKTVASDRRKTVRAESDAKPDTKADAKYDAKSETATPNDTKSARIVDLKFIEQINSERRAALTVPRKSSEITTRLGWAPIGPTYLMTQLYRKRKVLAGYPRSERWCSGEAYTSSVPQTEPAQQFKAEDDDVDGSELYEPPARTAASKDKPTSRLRKVPEERGNRRAKRSPSRGSSAS